MVSKTEKLAVPRSLKMAVVKIQAEQDMDWGEACEHLAELAELNGKKFKQAVSREANRRYKSRHMAELNKARKTFEEKGFKKGVKAGRVSGRREGEEEATKEWRISYPCNVCGELMYMKPGDEDTKVATELLRKTWGHSRCHKKQNQKGVNPLSLRLPS